MLLLSGVHIYSYFLSFQSNVFFPSQDLILDITLHSFIMSP